jgi:hypothetical protein
MKQTATIHQHLMRSSRDQVKNEVEKPVRGLMNLSRGMQSDVAVVSRSVYELSVKEDRFRDDDFRLLPMQMCKYLREN